MDISAAPATTALIVANLAASLYAFLVDPRFVNEFSFHIGAIVRRKQHWRIFTSSFLHGDYFHLAFNMMTLYFFGPVVEHILGTDGFLAVYFGAILASGIVSFYVRRHQLDYSSIGASDGVSGIVLSFCVFYPLEPIYIFFLPIGIPAILYGVIFIVISAGMMGRQGGRIAHEGHLGGAIAGVLLTIVMKPEVLSNWL